MTRVGAAMRGRVGLALGLFVVLGAVPGCGLGWLGGPRPQPPPEPIASGRLPMLADVFYQRIANRRFNSIATFQDPALREWPTVALTAATRAQGAMIHRVHEVKENREALRMMEAVLAAR